MKLYLLDFKNIRFHFWIPIVSAWIFIPLAVFICQRITPTDNLTDASGFIQMFHPFMAIWWIVFVFRQYADESGSELLHMYRRSQLPHCVFMQLFFLLITGVPYGILSCFYPDTGLEFLRIAVESFCLSSAAYCIIFTFRSATAAILVNLIYVAATWFVEFDISSMIDNPENLLVKYDLLSYLNIFSIWVDISEIPKMKFGVTAAIGFVFLMIGGWKNHNLFKNGRG